MQLCSNNKVGSNNNIRMAPHLSDFLSLSSFAPSVRVSMCVCALYKGHTPLHHVTCARSSLSFLGSLSLVHLSVHVSCLVSRLVSSFVFSRLVSSRPCSLLISNSSSLESPAVGPASLQPPTSIRGSPRRLTASALRLGALHRLPSPLPRVEAAVSSRDRRPLLLVSCVDAFLPASLVAPTS